MTKRMLIDATQPEETRVAVIENDRLDSYEFDSTIRKQIKGNIFLAKVTRVEPSLQACFVEYGGNRQGFLAFTEIHPDYYRIPVEDREALLAEEAEEWSDEDENNEQPAEKVQEDKVQEDGAQEDAPVTEAETVEGEDKSEDDNNDNQAAASESAVESAASKPATKALKSKKPARASKKLSEDDLDNEEAADKNADVRDDQDDDQNDEQDNAQPAANLTEIERDNTVESVGGGEDEEEDERRTARRIGKLRRRYKIQEVIKRRQIMLVQATKEERGAKGAAMTTYISLPGRYCVLMPNSPRGGGISRKITDPQARRKMKDLLSELDVPSGMSVILRTAGLTRTRLDIKRDLEYLLRLWDEIRRETMQSEAPALIYEEADIFKRTIRDLYTSETKEVIIAGEEGFKKVKTFMRQMVPLHAKRVFYYRDPMVPLFQRYGIEPQIANIFNPRVELKSGGYIIINPTEALVSIDVNSGRATRERHIDDTALKTNLEAAEEVARQLRLRDLGGLVVIDFIDMESSRHNAKVERKLRDAMSGDRARIEIGRISAFGLLELSRQRLHPSLTETHFCPCTHCHGTGITRTTDSAAVVVMRAIESEAARGRAIGVTATVPAEVALYLLNHKREDIARIEECFGCRVAVRIGDEMNPNDFEIGFEKGTPKTARQVDLLPVPVLEGSDDDFISAAEEEDDGEPLLGHAAVAAADADDNENDGEEKESTSRNGRRRNTRSHSRGRRRSRSTDDHGDKESGSDAVIIPITTDTDNALAAVGEGSEMLENPTDSSEAKPRRRNNDRRGNRHPYRRRRNNNGERSQDGNDSPSTANAPSVPSVPNVEAAPVAAVEKKTRVSKAAKEKAASADAVANDATSVVASSAAAKESKKKGWWQKLIE